jgi:hypothetical protein
MSETDGSNPVPGGPGTAATVEALDRLFLAFKTLALHGASHPSTLQGFAEVAGSLAEAGPPFALQFIQQAVFRDNRLLAMDLESFVRARDTAKALANLGVNELSVDRPPSAQAALALGEAIARGFQGPGDVLEDRSIQGFRWRRIAAAGNDAESVDSDIFVLAQITLALADAEACAAGTGGAWPWVRGVAVVRRVERAVAMDPAAAVRVMEAAPGEWTVARRAVAATLHVVLVMQRIRATTATRRAAAHAVLALACHGLRPAGASPLAQAAAAALPTMIHATTRSRASVEPHRLRTSAVVHAFARSAGPGDGIGAAPLVALAYQLEGLRCPSVMSFDLTLVDLLAMASRESGRLFHPTWVCALTMCCGVCPPGSLVRLADGRHGMVVAAGPPTDPWRPSVLVDGRVTRPEQPVVPVSATSGARERRA